MDESNDKNKIAETAQNGRSEEKGRDKRAKNAGRKQGRRPQNKHENDRQPKDATQESAVSHEKPKTKNQQQSKNESQKKRDDYNKKDRTGKRRQPQQSRNDTNRGAKQSTVEKEAHSVEVSYGNDEKKTFESSDRFADISLFDDNRIGRNSSEPLVSTSADSYELPPDAFRIPDDEILPECLLPHSFTPTPVKQSENTTEVVGIRFENSGKTYYFAPGADKFVRGEHAIVETSRGVEYGEISMGNTFVPNETIVQPLRAVGRRANEEDARRNEENHRREAAALTVCAEKIAAHGLDMKLVGSSYTFDNTKLIFYFTAAGRVDFRELVKDLASVFRTRIELRQIGIRDEAKMLGGCGVCGRKLCCASFLPNFTQVSIRMAKEQGLSLSSSKISGCCGRLMCCLRFEHDTYEQEIKLTPPVDSIVETADGRGIVTENSPIAGTVKVRLDDKPGDPPKTYHRDSVRVIARSTRQPDRSTDSQDDDSDVLPDE